MLKGRLTVAIEKERQMCQESERECRAMMDERILIGSQRRATMVVALPWPKLEIG